MGLIIVGIFLATVVLATVVIGGSGAYFIYRKRKNEIEAIREHTSKSIVWIDNVLVETNRFRSGDLPRIKEDLLNDINSCINKYTNDANNNVDLFMDSEFYSKALQGILPFGEGRKAFENSFKNIENQLIDREQLSKDLEGIGTSYEKKMRENLLAGISKIELNLSEKTKETLAKLKNNPSKLLEILGRNGKFKNIPQEDVMKEIGLTIGEIGIGIGVFTLVDPELVGDMIGDILIDTIGVDLVEQFTLEIKEWFVHEVGEEISTEIIEFLGSSVVPVISIFFLLFKAGKYINLYNRVFVEKEPLQKMRTSAKSSALKNLNKIGKSVYDTICSDLDKAISELEKNLVESRNKKEKMQSDFSSNKSGLPKATNA
jgi:hypothetical protein